MDRQRNKRDVQKQKEDGVIEGWHGDGNFARTAIMYALWKTQGCYINNWNENILIGSDLINDELNVLLYAKESWNGKLFFDTQRHERNLKLPIDWTRINQFPEWFTLDENTTYQICYNNKTYFQRENIKKGIAFNLTQKEKITIKIKAVKPQGNHK